MLEKILSVGGSGTNAILTLTTSSQILYSDKSSKTVAFAYLNATVLIRSNDYNEIRVK